MDEHGPGYSPDNEAPPTRPIEIPPGVFGTTESIGNPDDPTDRETAHESHFTPPVEDPFHGDDGVEAKARGIARARAAIERALGLGLPGESRRERRNRQKIGETLSQAGIDEDAGLSRARDALAAVVDMHTTSENPQPDESQEPWRKRKINQLREYSNARWGEFLNQVRQPSETDEILEESTGKSVEPSELPSQMARIRGLLNEAQRITDADESAIREQAIILLAVRRALLALNVAQESASGERGDLSIETVQPVGAPGHDEVEQFNEIARYCRQSYDRLRGAPESPNIPVSVTIETEQPETLPSPDVPSVNIDDQVSREQLHEWLWSSQSEPLIPEVAKANLTGHYTELHLRYDRLDKLVARHSSKPESMTVSTDFTADERAQLIDKLKADLGCQTELAQTIGYLPEEPSKEKGVVARRNNAKLRMRNWLRPKPHRKDPRKEAQIHEVIPTRNSRIALVVTRAGTLQQSEIQGVHVMMMPDPVFRLAADASARLEVTDMAKAYIVSPNTFQLSNPLPTPPGAISRIPETRNATSIPVIENGPRVPMPTPELPQASTQVPTENGIQAPYVPGMGTIGPQFLRAASSTVVEHRTGRQRERRASETIDLAHSMLGMKTNAVAHEALLRQDAVYRSEYQAATSAHELDRDRALRDFWETHAGQLAQQRELLQGPLQPHELKRVELLGQLLKSSEQEKQLQSLMTTLVKRAADATERSPIEIEIPADNPDDPLEKTRWAVEGILDLAIAARAEGATEIEQKADPFATKNNAKEVQEALSRISDIWLANQFIDTVYSKSVPINDPEISAKLGAEIVAIMTSNEADTGFTEAEFAQLGAALTARPAELRKQQEAEIGPFAQTFFRAFEALPDYEPPGGDDKKMWKLTPERIAERRQLLNGFKKQAVQNHLFEQVPPDAVADWSWDVKPVEQADSPRTQKWAPEALSVFQALVRERDLLDRQELDNKLKDLGEVIKRPDVKNPGDSWKFVEGSVQKNLADPEALVKAKERLIRDGFVERVSVTQSDGALTEVYKVIVDPNNRPQLDPTVAEIWQTIERLEIRNNLTGIQPPDTTTTTVENQPGGRIEFTPDVVNNLANKLAGDAVAPDVLDDVKRRTQDLIEEAVANRWASIYSPSAETDRQFYSLNSGVADEQVAAFGALMNVVNRLGELGQTVEVDEQAALARRQEVVQTTRRELTATDIAREAAYLEQTAQYLMQQRPELKSNNKKDANRRALLKLGETMVRRGFAIELKEGEIAPAEGILDADARKAIDTYNAFVRFTAGQTSFDDEPYDRQFEADKMRERERVETEFEDRLSLIENDILSNFVNSFDTSIEAANDADALRAGITAMFNNAIANGLAQRSAGTANLEPVMIPNTDRESEVSKSFVDAFNDARQRVYRRVAELRDTT